MEKILALIMALIMLLGLCACSADTATNIEPTTITTEPTTITTEPTTITTEPTTSEDYIISYYGNTDPEWIQYVDENVPELGTTWVIAQEDYEGQVWDCYFTEIQKRMENPNYWSGCELEEEFLDSLGYYMTIDEYLGIKGYFKDKDGNVGACPVVYKTTDGVGIMYIRRSGSLCFADPGRGYSTMHGDVHTQEQCELLSEGMPEEEAAQADLDIGSGHMFTAVYSKTTQTFEMWVFGEVVRSYQLPENAVFVGVSGTEGYLFRDGTDLYLVRDYTDDYYSSPTDGFGMNIIASNVRAVVSNDYFWDLEGYGEGDIDFSSQPLVLTTSNEILVYVPEEGVPANDPSNFKPWRGDVIH